MDDRAVRLAWPDVTPLQIWDLEVGGRRLWEEIDERNIAKLRLRGYSETMIAARVARVVVRACKALGRHPFDAVHVLGGLTLLPTLKERLWAASTPWPFFVSPSGRDYAWRAKGFLFGQDKMIVVDVGQTSIKGYLPDGERVVFRRNTELIPYGDCYGKADRAVHFIKSAVASLRSVAPDAPVLLALPAPVDRDLVPGESSYGFAGRKTFVREVIADPSCPVFVMNDAELAAECARGECGTNATLLVLTLGHGPGAAIVRPAG